MKIEQLLIPFLIQNKKFSLQGVGSFYLLTELIASKEDAQNLIFPDNSIDFKSDKNIGQDESLIQYIIENTKKIKPLATSDLESFTTLNKQFLNLGKPLVLEGIGSLTKNKEGIYEFTQANKTVIQKETPADQDSKKAEDRSFKKSNREYSSKKSKQSNWFIPVVILLLSIIVAFVVYFFLLNPKQSNQQTIKENEITASLNDTIKIKKTTIVELDSGKNPIQTTQNFKFIVRNYNSLVKAKKGYVTLTKSKSGKNIILYTKDSIEFYLAVPISAKSTDTLKIKDSLKLLFKKSVTVDFK